MKKYNFIDIEIHPHYLLHITVQNQKQRSKNTNIKKLQKNRKRFCQNSPST